MLKIALTFLLSTCLGLPAFAQQQRAPVDALLSAYITEAQSQCNAARAAQTPAQRAEQQGADEMICVCAPDEAHKLRASLPKAEGDRVLSVDAFQQQYAPRILNGCAAAQLRAQYQGERCTSTVPKGVDATAFCSCMEARVKRISDADVAKLGADMSDFGDSMRDALARHAPEPAKPDSVNKFMAMQSACVKP